MEKYNRDTLVAINSFMLESEHQEPFMVEKDSFWELTYTHAENTERERWSLSSSVQNIVVSAEIAKANLKNYVVHYQEQFANRDKNFVYFGQIQPGFNFRLEENGELVLYEKIDEYITSDGIKINAVRLPNNDSNNYWNIDSFDSYSDKTFCYFEPVMKVVANINYLGNNLFIPPRSHEVVEYFVLFPKMLDIVDYLFTHKPLTDELKEVAEKFQEYKDEQGEYWHSPDYFPYTEVKERIEEKLQKESDAKIMREIEYETEMFKRELIKKRFKR